MKQKNFWRNKKVSLASIHIQSEVYTETTRERDINDEWDGGEISKTHNILGFTWGVDIYGDLQTDLYPQPNKEYYLVYVDYDTGDSFSVSRGERFYVQLYENKEKAQRLCEKIRTFNYLNRGQTNLEVEFNCSKTYQIYCPWIGYFEHFNYVDIEVVKMLED